MIRIIFIISSSACIQWSRPYRRPPHSIFFSWNKFPPRNFHNKKELLFPSRHFHIWRQDLYFRRFAFTSRHLSHSSWRIFFMFLLGNWNIAGGFIWDVQDSLQFKSIFAYFKLTSVLDYFKIKLENVPRWHKVVSLKCKKFS